MDQRTKIRLLLVGGTIMFIMTLLIVMYGFKRTEELRAEEDVVSLMAVPRTAIFGAPVGLILGAGSEAEPAEGSAAFEDGMIATLVGVEERACVACTGQKELLAVLKLQGGTVPQGANAFARISSVTAMQWGDYGYLFSLLEIGTGYVVFSVDVTRQ